jgi:cyclic pyranopterin phosphate synthase
MARGFIDSVETVWRYIAALSRHGVTEFTFKHTYVAYEQSVFAAAPENQWARDHQVQTDPFVAQGEVLARLPWGPAIRRIGSHQVCYYFEPDPSWELEHQLCRSVNLLSDGSVYASLEDRRSRLYRLNGW